ncbi:MAG TPA: hypothetical protein VEW25_00315 [Allosphingosinicella sp.]|nr:hypothetical protein [Allosphingosinicella sp.]
MPSIENLLLKLEESQGAAAALVTYDLRGSTQDVQQQARYIELVQLIGDDKRPGEDGVDEVIVNDNNVGDSIVFTNTSSVSRPARLIALPSSALDEDPGHDHPQQPRVDEIRARVTLTRIQAPVIGESNIVERGGFIVPPGENASRG